MPNSFSRRTLKKKFRFQTFLKLLFLPAALFLSVSIVNYADSSSSYRSARAFDQFTEELFSTEIASSTLNLHYTLEHPENYGVEEVPITFGSAEDSGLLAGASPTISEYLRDLYRIPYHALSEEDQLTYDLLSLSLETDKDSERFRLYDEPLGPTIGVQAQLPILLAEYDFRSAKDIDTYLALLKRMDLYYQSLLDYEISKSAAGLFMGQANVEAVIRQCRSFAAARGEENFLISIFDEKIRELDFLTDSQRQVYAADNRSAVEHHVIPAYELLADGLEKLKSTGCNPNGLCYFPQGRAYYEYLIRSGCGSWLPVSGIEKRIQTQLTSDLQARRTLLTKDPQLLMNASFAGLPTDPDQILQDLQKKMQTDFPKAEKVNCRIKYVHDSLEDYLSPAFYLTPPIDNTRDNTIYINRAADYSALELYTTLAHEGYPGHLYQNISSYESLSPVRSLFGCGGYTEGWATYVEMESYAYAAKSMTDPRAEEIAELTRLNRSIMLGISSLLDIRIHYRGYTRQETADFLEHLGFSGQAAADAIYDAILESPGNYLKYYLGYLSFADLRTYCQQEYSENFTLIGFHEKILEIGPCPFPVLEKYMKAWYRSQS